MPRVREAWPDAVKIFACVLVVLSHFSQSMVKSGFMEPGALYGWFQMTAYTFQVPLFFVCSGYLYERFSAVDSPASWWLNVRKKALALGVPYFFFSLVTLGLKLLAGDAVNNVEAGVVEALFLHPISPYWFLYTLFLIFLITPTAGSRRGAVVLLGLSGMAMAAYIGGACSSMPYFVSSVAANWLWFVGGMCLSSLGWLCRLGRVSTLVGAMFLPLSVAVFALGPGGMAGGCAKLLVGVLACVGTVSACKFLFPDGKPHPVAERLSVWTMPVYLMHTIFAAGVRVLIVRMGVTSAAVHIAVGLVASFVGPVLAITVMDKLKPLDFFMYPNRYVKLGRKH